jgi:hypothetical protein
MPRAAVAVEIDAPCEAVFALVHDYDRRLEWDSMLRSARLLAGATAAGVGVKTLCVGTWKGAFLAMETEYVSFEPGRVAAVKLTNRPPFFEQLGATIRHEPVGPTRSRTTYVYSFRARPRWLAPLLEPLMAVMITREIRARLDSLRRVLERSGTNASPQR